MPHQRIADEILQQPFSEEQIDNAVLGYLLYGPSWPWSVDELARELGHEGNAIDAVRRLTRTGLVHRFDEFVIPTRTARRAYELRIGTV
jgi:predicted transcriptional regulator